MNPSPGTVNTANFCNILRHQENEEQHSVNVTDPACGFTLRYCYFDSVEEIQRVQASSGQNWTCRKGSTHILHQQSWKQ